MTRFLLLLCVLGTIPLQGAYLLKNGHFINEKDMATGSVELHFQRGLDALSTGKWEEAHQQFHIVVVSFPDASLADEAQYYLGVALYKTNELYGANNEFTTYLQTRNASVHAEDVYRYKLAIAQKLANGALVRLFGYQFLPKLQTAREKAIELFDEVAAALPNHDLAASALIRKARLLRRQQEFAHAIESYQTAIRRFPGTKYALKAYQEIASCYVGEMRRQPHNVDDLTLAEINLKELKKEFPQAEEITDVEAKVRTGKELYVNALYETAQLYERMSQPKAAILYYHLAIDAFPDSSVALLCKERMHALSAHAEELHVPLT
jgi:outer membrane protein assembly factor BamD (BamD/ComL family)